ncbi:MAG: hypothetical protein HY815_23590 [Candidatus Riflebacteria bacterium]|nr:hypothetical protein [Candidatus Riflebacteria bacterium]
MTTECRHRLGPLLSDPRELLWRQVHPGFIHDGRVSSQAFTPTPKDEGLLSVARESLTTAKDAFRHHVETLGFASAGVMAVSVGECLDASLNSYDQPLPHNPAHAIVDFRALSDKQTGKTGRKLAALARSRGFVYQQGS